ncbi:hypothetical protein LSH36_275g00019 [Paralvinella palmiformis]|uniref:Uncharacterized protein n=1 Tax=Paralvinella palmiformis TaxID=53620 RepID=A0AAD9N3Y1_9ANNE|nr:hypothetical protein LSH36_275g00019 [Paralvinella palmiformis]
MRIDLVRNGTRSLQQKQDPFDDVAWGRRAGLISERLLYRLRLAGGSSTELAPDQSRHRKELVTSSSQSLYQLPRISSKFSEAKADYLYHYIQISTEIVSHKHTVHPFLLLFTTNKKLSTPGVLIKVVRVHGHQSRWTNNGKMTVILEAS